MGKKIFFISLVVLSLAMAQHWFKHRPKPQKRTRPRTAIRLEDLQNDGSDLKATIATGTDGLPGATAAADSTPSDAQATAGQETTAGTTPASGAVSLETTTASATPTLPEDPVLAFFAQPHRTPFTRSPFLKLVDELRKTMMEKRAKSGGTTARDSTKIRPTQLYSAQFVGTIQTDKELVAIVEKNLYRSGDTFQGMQITQIASSHIVMENDTGVFVLPKHGVQVQIASGAVVDVVDNFLKGDKLH